MSKGWQFFIFNWAIPVNTHVEPVRVKPLAVACSFYEQSNQMFSSLQYSGGAASYLTISMFLYSTDSKNVKKAKTMGFQHSIQESRATNLQV